MKTIETIIVAIAALVVVAVFATVRPEIFTKVPYRKPTYSDDLLAKVINSLDTDMRSIEIGSWFLSRLRAQILAKPDPIRCDTFIDLADIANAVPGANVVTKSEIIKRLQRVVDFMFKGCGGSMTKAELVRVLDAYEDSAFHPRTGLLLSMPGYSLKSSKPLPK